MLPRLTATLLFLAYISNGCLSYCQHMNSKTASNPVPLCNSGVIDATFGFRDQPAGEQTVSLYFLNKSNIACRLTDPSCPFCGPDGRPTWNRHPENGIVLAPGARAAIDINWNSTGESCKWKDWTNFSFVWTEN
jgi:Protein of unknown function (DUF4232)